MMTLYTKGTAVDKLWKIFFSYFSKQTRPTARHLFELVLSLFALNGYRSVRFFYEHFIRNISNNSLTSYYYALNESKIDLQDWLEKLSSAALDIIPSQFSEYPIVLAIDDTMVEKFGTSFECRSCLFDHASHNGSNYLNGHCFVSLLMHVPVSGFQYLPVPLGYRMWDKSQSKLDMAANLVRTAMESIGTERPVILCCDSWYPKGAICDLIQEYKNLTLICNVRSDTVLYDLPPEKNGKRGRPRKKGKRITVQQIPLSDVPRTDYSAGAMPVKTNLFGDRIVTAIVTKAKKGNSVRLFLSTQSAEQLSFPLDFLRQESAVVYPQTNPALLPLAIYSLRWNIEVSYYEQKTFWGFGAYMLQSKTGVERLVNLLSLVFSALILLPFQSQEFSALKGQSPQEIRFILGQLVQQQVFLTAFDAHTKSENISRYMENYLIQVVSSLACAA